MSTAATRRNMVNGQVRPCRVRDPDLIRALAAVPRDVFVPVASRGFAYLDRDLSLGAGRWLIEPMMVARLLDAAGIAPADRVLVVGDACGYIAALVAQLAAGVVALDCDGDWVQKAAAILADLGLANVETVHGSLLRGDPIRAPFNAIVLCGAVEAIPPAISAQLADGGRLVAVVGGGGLGKLVRVVRNGDQLGRSEILEARLPPLAETVAKASFSL